MDREVSQTLAELEHKLRELELAIEAAGYRGSGYTKAGDEGGGDLSAGPEWEHVHGGPEGAREGARLVDEGIAAADYDIEAPGYETEPADDDLETGMPGPPHATTAPEPGPPPMAGSPQTSSASPAPDPPPGPSQARRGLSGEAIELEELVRFRERLDSTMRDLVEEYTRIISLGRSI